MHVDAITGTDDRDRFPGRDDAHSQSLRGAASDGRAGRTTRRGHSALISPDDPPSTVVMVVTTAQISYRIRPIAPSDRQVLTRFYAGLSPDSLEARFHGAVPGIGDGTARFFCGPDHEHREGLVVEATDARGRPMIVGHLCLEPTSPDEAEMAIAVADALQRHGLGRALLLGAVSWARDHGVATLSASIRGSNGAMLGLIRSMGLPVTVHDADVAVIDAVIDLGVPLPDVA